MNSAYRTYIIAEAGVNHNGSIDLARQMIEVAAEAGVDAVKFQTFKAEKVISQYADKAAYQVQTTGGGESQLEMLKKLEISQEDHRQLFELCRKKGIDYLSTPFDSESLCFLVNELKLSRLKIASGEITNLPFLLEVALTDKPVILSSGMCTLGEIESALGVLACGYLKLTEEDNKPSAELFKKSYCSAEGQILLKEKVALLHCTTEYPAPYEEVNLRAIDTMRSAFDLLVGLSDHTQGIAVAIAAAARGARIIEKHFTLDIHLAGPDHKASLEPDELKAMVASIRQVEAALGKSQKYPSPSEFNNIIIARKSIVAAKPINKGELFTEENLAIKRSGDGLEPIRYWYLLGKLSDKNYNEDELITD